jgi:DNA modification methylase
MRTPDWQSDGASIYCGDCLEVLRDMPEQSINCCVTSPPYFGLRDYGHAGQIGLEPTPDEYVAKMVEVFHEVRRVLRDDGTLWLNIGDSYCAPNGRSGGGTYSRGPNSQLAHMHKGQEVGIRRSFGEAKPKDLIGIPWMVAFALRADGWYLRDAIVWAKPNGMPGSQQDRCTSSYELVFLLSKSPRYWSDFDAIKTPPRESSLVRTAQDLQSQAGSHRANGGGKSNGAMKAVGVRSDKQRGHSRTHAGFNARWDAMYRTEQMAMPAMMRNVWFVSPAQSKDMHFAVMPNEIARRCVLAGCPEGGKVLDPFNGSGTTGEVCVLNNRQYVGVELNPAYVELASKRIGAAERDAPRLFTAHEQATMFGGER